MQRKVADHEASEDVVTRKGVLPLIFNDDLYKLRKRELLHKVLSAQKCYRYDINMEIVYARCRFARMFVSLHCMFSYSLMS